MRGGIKALVLAGGTGTRLKPLTNTTTKQLLPVANRPILFYIMDLVREAGIRSAGIIVSAEWGEPVKQAVGDGSRWGMEISYIVQPRPAGLAHAVKTAVSFLGDSPFLMVLGDNVYKCDIKGFVAQFGPGTDALLLLKGVEDAAGFGTAELNAEGRVTGVQEKSPQPKSNLALAGIYLFSPAIHEAIEQTKPSKRGELEITDAIQSLIDMKKTVRGHSLDGWWLDTGDMDDLLKANRAVLDEFLRPATEGSVDARSQISGKVEVREGTVIENSFIQGPASIAENCRVKNSRIGQFTCIGPGSVIEDSSVADSVVLANCRIRGIKHVSGSLIGKNVELAKSQQPGTIGLALGDDARLQI